MNKKISLNLKDCKFIKVKKDSKVPYSEFKGDDWNHNLLNIDQANSFLEEGFNVGLVGGETFTDYNLVNIDCDSVEPAQYCETNFSETYTEATTSGGMHYLFKSYEHLTENKTIKWGKRSLGEIRVRREFVVTAPSKAINKKGEMGEYVTVKDLPLATITREQIEALLNEFKTSDSTVTPNMNEDIEKLIERVNTDEELKKLFEGNINKGQRSEAEQSLTNKLRARDFTKEEAYKIVANSQIGKLKEKPISYWELMWNKSLNYVTSGKSEYVEKKINEAKPLKTLTLRDYKNHKTSRCFIIEGIMRPKECSMKHGPSGCLKSIESLYEGLCIASGKKFLDKFKTKKQPVLYVSGENSIDLDKHHIERIMKAMKIRSHKIPFYVLPRSECQDVLESDFTSRLCKTIQELNIKVIYLDTINPLTPSLDDNKAKDVTRVFNEFLKPLIDKYNLHIQFLHHTDKKGDNFLGSMKWFANVDQVFRFDRKDLHNQITIFNEKDRMGESKTKEVEIQFTEKSIHFKILSEGDPSKYNKKKKMNQQEFFILKLNQLGVPKDATRKEIQIIFEENGIKFSEPTLDRALKSWREE